MNAALIAYAAALRRWWRILAAVTLASLTIAAVYLISQPTQYQSTAVLFVTTPRDDAQTAYAGNDYVKKQLISYVALGRSPAIAQRVANSVGLDVDPETLLKGTKLAPIPNTVLLELTTIGNTPYEAQAIGDAYVAELRRSIEAIESVSGALTPRADSIPVQSPTIGRLGGQLPSWIILGSAGLFGLFLGALTAVAVSLLDGRIRRPEDASEATGTPVLARIASGVPWEAPGVQPWASDFARELRQTLDRLAALGTKVILVSSADRGAGKTTVALSLGRALADRNSSVVLADFDSRGSRLAAALGLTNATTVCALVENHDDRPAEDSRRKGQPHQLSSRIFREGLLTVIPFGSSRHDPGSAADSRGTASLFAAFRRRYDWVIVDTPAAIEFSDASRLARHADAVLLVARLGRSRFDDLRKVSIELTHAGGHVAGVVLVDEAAVCRPSLRRYRKSKAARKSSGRHAQAAILSRST